MTSGIRWASSLACGLWVATAHAATTAGPSQHEVTAAYLFNFSKYVEWPEGTFTGAADPITICVLGESPLGTLLGDAVKGKRVNGREIAVRETSSISKTAGCHIVFLPSSENGRLAHALDELADRPVLTVSSARSIADRGAVIGLTLEERRIRFEVNLAAAGRAGLKLSSQLLKVAVRLIGQEDRRP
jgi:hypothetical protein